MKIQESVLCRMIQGNSTKEGTKKRKLRYYYKNGRAILLSEMLAIDDINQMFKVIAFLTAYFYSGFKSSLLYVESD